MRGVLLVVFCLLPLEALGAISFDAVSTSAVTSGTTSISWNHTTGGGSDRLLEVCVTARNDGSLSSTAVTSVTYGGIPMTATRSDLVNAGGGGTIARTSMFQLVAPPAGTSAVAVTMAGTVDLVLAGFSVSLAGVDQTTPLDATNGATDSTGLSTIQTTVTTVTDGAWILDCAFQGTGFGATWTVGANQTSRVNRIVSQSCCDDHQGGSTEGPVSPGGHVMDWSSTAPQAWVISAASFKPVIAVVGGQPVGGLMLQGVGR